MDSQTAILIAIVFLILFSAFFSATETAYASLSQVRLKNLAENGSKRAQQALDLATEYDTLLSTILVGNNIVNIAASSLGTVYFTTLLGNQGVTVATIVITMVVLLFSEITPKNLANEYSEAYAMAVAPFIRFFVLLFKPVNWLFKQWRKLLAKIFKTNTDAFITEDELLTLVDEARQEGAITVADQQLIDQVIAFNDNQVMNILTPRIDLHAVPIDAKPDEIRTLFVQSGYSRLPVYEESIDKIIGVIHIRDFFANYDHAHFSLSEWMTPVIHVTETKSIHDLLTAFQEQKIHMAIVTNEYGETDGIVTMEDILEELVGEIWDEHDVIEQEIEQVALEKYVVKGSADADDVLSLFNIEDDYQSNTINGWFMEKLHYFPREGEIFEVLGLRVTVLQLDRHRVEKCIIERATADNITEKE